MRETQNLRAYMDLSQERQANRSGDAGRLAGDFDQLALVSEGGPGSVDPAAEEEEMEERPGLEADA